MNIDWPVVLIVVIFVLGAIAIYIGTYPQSKPSSTSKKRRKK